MNGGNQFRFIYMHLKQIIDDLHESHDNKDFAYAHIYTHTHMYGKMDVYV